MTQGISIPQLVPSDLSALMSKWRFINVPLVGWIPSHTGTGNTTPSLPMVLVASSGATGGSRGMMYLNLRGLSPVGSYTSINFSKAIRFILEYGRAGNDAGSIHRFHIKNAATAADMVANGLGIKVLKDALWGESFGTAGELVNLNFTLTTNYINRIEIVLVPGVRVEWWVNGVLKGTQTDTTKVPSGSLTCSAGLSSVNVAGVDCYSLLTNFQILQEP